MLVMRYAAAVGAGLASLPVILFVIGAAIGEIAGCSADATATACPLSGRFMLWSIPALILVPPALLVIVGWIVAEIVNAWRR